LTALCTPALALWQVAIGGNADCMLTAWCIFLCHWICPSCRDSTRLLPEPPTIESWTVLGAISRGWCHCSVGRIDYRLHLCGSPWPAPL